MSALQVSKADIEECQDIVNNFRVNELNLLLTSYHYPKLGKKQDLVQRAKSLLTNTKYQLSAVQKIREIQASNRLRQAPYTVPTANVTSNNTDMRRQQFLGNNANPISRHAMLHQAVNNMGQSFNGVGQSGLGFPMFNHFSAGNSAPGMYSGFGYGSTNLPGGTTNSGGGGGSSSSNISGQARNLRIVALPFFDSKSTVVPMTELPSFNIPPRPGEARHLCQFGFPPDDIAKLYYKDKPLPRYEIQFRMFLLDTSKEQEDAFPPGCIVKLDDYNVTLPNVIPTNKPNAEQKRLSRPVNLTPYCQPPRPRDRPHRMLIEWNGDKRAWAFAIFIVFRLNTQILEQRLLQNVAARRSFQSTKSIIIKRLNGDDEDGIEMDSLKISLLCPLMRTRIKMPARAIDCTHLQFFDLTNYLMMCEKRPVWKCPVCDNQALYSKLIIDQYFQRLIETTDPSVDEVELLRDGSWRVFREEMVDLSDNDNEDDVVVATTSKKKVPVAPKQEVSDTTPKASSVQSADCDVITLSDTDDEEDEDSEASNNVAAVAVQNENKVTTRPITDTTPEDVVMSSADDGDDSTATSSKTISSPKRDVESAPASNSAPAQRCDVITLSDSGEEDEGQENEENNETSKEPVCQNGNAQNGNGLSASTNLHSPVFRPVIDEVAKTYVAKELASFLQSVCAKNSMSSTSTATTGS